MTGFALIGFEKKKIFLIRSAPTNRWVGKLLNICVTYVALYVCLCPVVRLTWYKLQTVNLFFLHFLVKCIFHPHFTVICKMKMRKILGRPFCKKFNADQFWCEVFQDWGHRSGFICKKLNEEHIIRKLGLFHPSGF